MKTEFLLDPDRFAPNGPFTIAGRRGPPPIIAIVGCDGSGKSTLAAALLAWLGETRHTELCHLGKQTGNIGRALARWPLIGRRLGTSIRAKTQQVKDAPAPGPMAAAAIYLLSMRRVRRFRRMLAVRGAGATILADRFPQLGVPGPMDGLGLAKGAAGGMIARALARRERRHYAWMATHRPTLVIRLNVDLETAIARKPDHRPASLKRKTDDVPRLTFEGAPIVEIDAGLPFDRVLRAAKQAISAALAGV